MAQPNAIQQFVREALTTGRTRAEITAALKKAGWSESEIDDALTEYAEVDFVPPVPRPRAQLSARDAFIWALLFTALGFSAVYLINLLHALLDIWLPDTADRANMASYATKRIRWAVSVMVIAMPVFLWMTYYTGQQGKRDTASKRSLVRKWLTYLAMFVTAFAFFADATIVIYHFLTGDLTIRFLLKAATVAIVAVAIFGFYLKDVEEIRNET